MENPETALDMSESPQAAQAAPAPDPVPDDAGGLKAALDKREGQLALAERRLAARALLMEKALPREMIGLLDLSDDERMRATLQLAEQLLRDSRQVVPQTPKAPAFTPAQAGSLSYTQRAALYRTDMDSYRQIYGGKNL